MTESDDQAQPPTTSETTSNDTEPPTEGSAPDTVDERASRTRTRTRSRTRERPGEASRGAGRGAAAADGGTTDDAARGANTTAGRGDRSSAPDDDAPDASSDGASDGASDDSTSDGGSGRAGSAGTRRKRRRGGRGRGRGRKAAAEEAAAGPASKKDAGEDRTGGDTDEQVEQAIASGGTRVAARRGRNGQQRRGTARVGGVSEDVRRAMLEGPPRTMLVTAGPDRTQIAVLEDRTVVEHYVTKADDVTYVGNIYMARVQNVLPGMEAAFLDIGKGRNGVLYAGEVLYDELDLEEGADHRIENALKPGQKVLVQVTKDPMGSKGPRLTMHLSLAGRYMVLAPNSDLFGISRKLTDQERDRLRSIVKQIRPSEHGLIVRTAAEGATDRQVEADLDRLLAKWARVEEAAADAKALTAVYEEPQLVVKVIRDNFGPEFVRCVVDDEGLYHEVRSYLGEVAPELLGKVELYGEPSAGARQRAIGSDDTSDAAPDSAPDAAPDAAADLDADLDAVADDGADDGAPRSLGPDELKAAEQRRGELPPLFESYDVADQLRKAMSRKVWLPSGGYLIIESTEAMKVIDVNTGKFTGDADTNLEEVVLKTNLEAADEIVRQLRLRDMGGIIIIDFIDMLLKANQDQVVRRLKRELLRDRTKTRVSEVSRLGLVQMTRKNVSQGLVEAFSTSCTVCEGRGIISELE